MGDSSPQAATVLVVEDERPLADLYAEWLRESYTVRIAYDGDDALELLDGSIDVVLLDRRMPGLSGDEVLAEIRNRDLDTRVAMVTAVDPDFDLVEMPFDAYVTKPVSGDDLHEVVERLASRATYDWQVREYYRLVETKAALDAEMAPGDLAVSQPYADLKEQFASLREDLGDRLDEFDEADFEAVFSSLSQHPEQESGESQPLNRNE